MRILTWNLNGLDDTHRDLRSEAAAVRLLALTPPPDIILLQEVAPRSFHAHLRPHLAAAGFTMPAAPHPDKPADTLVAVRPGLAVHDHDKVPFGETLQGRGLQWVELVGGWTVATAHLESMKGGAPERRWQLGMVAQWLRTQPGPAVFAGDTNLRQGDADQVDLTGITDAHEALGKPKSCASTWPAPDVPKGPRCRFDRAYLNAQAKALTLRRVGDEPVPSIGGTPLVRWTEMVSDHWGLFVEAERAP